MGSLVPGIEQQRFTPQTEQGHAAQPLGRYQDWQMPCTHTWSASQVSPQSPQCSGWLARVAEGTQLESPGLHASAAGLRVSHGTSEHCPSPQNGPALSSLHRCSQAPQ